MAKVVDNSKKDYGKARKVFNTIINVIWACTGGLIDAIYYIIMGIVAIFFIPYLIWGVPAVYFHVARIVFMPVGLSIKINFSHKPVRNIFWAIFGGTLSALITCIGAVFMCCTVIGLPIGLQLFKLGKYLLFPFGATIYKGNKLIVADKQTKKEIAEKEAAAKKEEEDRKRHEEEMEQQRKFQEQLLASANQPKSKYAELGELKELLDKGIITQAEFDAKKAEILK